METDDRERYKAGLSRELDRLRTAYPHELEVSWDATLAALDALYRWENTWMKSPSDRCNYLRDRRKSADGRILGALIWLRGGIDHAQAKIDEALEVSWDDEPMTWDGEPVTWGSTLRWRSLSNLPRRPDKRGDKRHEWYKADVAGKEFLEPLERAFRFVSMLS